MESIRIQIPHELFTPAESAHFDGIADMGELKVGCDIYTFPDRLAWQADITNTGDALLVAGSVEGEAKTACARCLEDASFSFKGSIEGYFLTDAESSHVPDDMDDDEFDILPEDHTIEMDVLITAAVLLEMPLVPLCRKDCKGLCPVCGANLNEGSCDCVVSQEDEDFELAKNPFAALKDFSFDE